MKALLVLLAPLFLCADFSVESPDPSLISAEGCCQPPAPTPPCCPPCPKNNWITLGADYTRVHLDPGSQSSYTGNMGGLQGFYEYAPDNDFYGAIRFKYRQGSSSGSDGKRDLLDLNMAEYMGYSWACTDWFFSAFTGFGFRYLGHDYKPSPSESAVFNGSFFPAFLTPASSLKFGYYEFYIPVGLITEYTFNSSFTLCLYATWMPQVFPTVNIRPLGGTFWSLSHTYGNVLIEMPCVFTLNASGSWNLSISPFYERWQDGHTTAETTTGIPLGLPGNTYNFYGLDVNLIYGF